MHLKFKIAKCIKIELCKINKNNRISQVEKQIRKFLQHTNITSVISKNIVSKMYQFPIERASTQNSVKIRK